MRVCRPLWRIGLVLALSMLLAVVAAACARTTPAATKAPAQTGVQVNGRAPDFTVHTVDGQTVSLSTALSQGKPVLLYFFTSW